MVHLLQAEGSAKAEKKNVNQRRDWAGEERG
jgi:hypothetical protein